MSLLRWLAAFVTLVLGIFGISTLQKKFDEGDLRKALAVVEAKAPPKGLSGCRAEIVSRWRGRMRIRCDEGSWIVDVIGGTLEKEQP